MWDEWGKCIKRQCAILLVFNSMAHCHNGKMLSQMGNQRAITGCFSTSLRFRWLCQRICGIPCSLLLWHCRKHHCGACRSMTWICRNVSETLPPRLCHARAAWWSAKRRHLFSSSYSLSRPISLSIYPWFLCKFTNWLWFPLNTLKLNLCYKITKINSDLLLIHDIKYLNLP